MSISVRQPLLGMSGTWAHSCLGQQMVSKKKSWSSLGTTTGLDTGVVSGHDLIQVTTHGHNLQGPNQKGHSTTTMMTI